MVKLKDTFISLATAGYIQQSPVEEVKEGCEIPTLVPVATIVPELDTRTLMQAMANPSEIKDSEFAKITPLWIDEVVGGWGVALLEFDL